jgi:hypothetical protein
MRLKSDSNCFCFSSMPHCVSPCDISIQEIELFMSDADKSNATFFPKFVTYVVLPAEWCCHVSLLFYSQICDQISSRDCSRGRGQVIFMYCKRFGVFLTLLAAGLDPMSIRV